MPISVREKLLAIEMMNIIQDLGLEVDCPFIDVLNKIHELQNPWTPVQGTANMPVGEWIVQMEDGKKGMCETFKGANGIMGIINGRFYFDYSPVVAYMPLPRYEGD